VLLGLNANGPAVEGVDKLFAYTRCCVYVPFLDFFLSFLFALSAFMKSLIIF
jgi:hypothetical protein